STPKTRNPAPLGCVQVKPISRSLTTRRPRAPRLLEPQTLQNRIRDHLTLTLPVPGIPDSADLKPLFPKSKKSYLTSKPAAFPSKGRIKLGRGQGRGGGRDPEPGAGTLGSGWARVAPVRGLRPPVAPRSPGGEEVGRPRYLEDQGGPRPGSHLRRAPPARPPAPIHPDTSRAPTPTQHRPGAAPPGEGICPRSAPAAAATRTSLSAGPPPPRPSPPERRAPRPPPLSAPARSAPRNSRPAHFKGPPGTSKRAGRPPPRPRTHQGSARGLSAQTSRAPWAGPRPRPPDRLAAAAPGPPGPVPASGNMGESRGRGGSAGNPAAREGAEARPAAPLSAEDTSGPRPRRGRPRLLRPPPGPAFDTGPASSNHSGHPTSSGRFQQKLRRGFHCALQRREPAHGPEREVRARRAPGRPRRPGRPSPGPSGSRPPSRPPLGRAGPSPAPCARDAAGRDLAPGPGGTRLGSGSAGAAPPPPPFTAQLSPGETGALDARRPGDP
ncbi:hypothetical protein EI555_000346, partial [Monodon monoceros]